MRNGPELRASPDRDTFERLARTWPMVPVWAEVFADLWTPLGAFLSVARDGPGVLLESVERSERWGRYSFVAGAPAATIVADADGVRLHDVRRELPIPDRFEGSDVLSSLKAVSAALAGPRLPELPALTGGLVGYLAYEAAALLDGLPFPGRAPCPPIALHVVDRALVFDHWRQRLLLVAHVPSRAADAYARGRDALEETASALASSVRSVPEPVDVGSARGHPHPIVETGDGAGGAFVEAVGVAKDHILAGDIFQVVLSRRISAPAPDGAVPVYRRLRITNPAPYMFLLRMADGLELAGSSPEPLVRVQGRTVSSRPIAGTRRRGDTEDEDLALERDLLADPKERAEHAMLVDLARNDLGRVCTPGSVRPTELMGIERFSQVMHIVSTVEGELRDGLEPLDALAATFPAGTVTGAPKRRAMEIIAEHEPVARGPYAGAVGYLTFAGDLDVCITIRTAVVDHGASHVQSGAGIVHDSDAASELRETQAKASAVLAALAKDDSR